MWPTVDDGCWLVLDRDITTTELDPDVTTETLPTDITMAAEE